MYSTLKRSLIILPAALAMPGCALRQVNEAGPPKTVDPVVDVTGPHRNFAPVAATYENTGVLAWHTQYPIVPARDLPDVARPVVEPAIFLANYLIFPITAIFTEPLPEQQVWRPVNLPPGYTAAVPLDSVFEIQGGGAMYPNMKPGLGSDLYGHAPAGLPATPGYQIYGNPQWMRPTSAAPSANSDGSASSPAPLPGDLDTPAIVPQMNAPMPADLPAMDGMPRQARPPFPYGNQQWRAPVRGQAQEAPPAVEPIAP